MTHVSVALVSSTGSGSVLCMVVLQRGLMAGWMTHDFSRCATANWGGVLGLVSNLCQADNSRLHRDTCKL